MKYLRKFENWESSEIKKTIHGEELEDREGMVKRNPNDPYSPYVDPSEAEEEPSEEEEGDVIPPFEDPNEDLPEPYKSIHGHGQPHIRKF